MSNVEKETLVPLADAAEVGLGVGRRTLGRTNQEPAARLPFGFAD